MRATVIATTRSGSRYVILMDDDGVQWTSDWQGKT